MDSSVAEEITHEFPPFFRVYKNGAVERFFTGEHVPPSTDPSTGVQSKDIVVDPKSGVSVRIYLPQLPQQTQKLPLLVYIHGGAFSIGSAHALIYHRHLTSLAAEAGVIALSVDYRLAPEHPLPAAYEDSWAVVQWAAMHSKGDGPESWLNDHADFERVYFVGDSAGANIAYNMVDRAGENNGPNGLKIIGMVLVHPFFMVSKPDKLIEYIFPATNVLEDPRMNPRVNPKLERLGCSQVLILVAENDRLKDRGYGFHLALKESGWKGWLDIVETEAEDHVFHLFNPKSENAVLLVKRVAAFIKSPQQTSNI